MIAALKEAPTEQYCRLAVAIHLMKPRLIIIECAGYIFRQFFLWQL